MPVVDRSPKVNKMSNLCKRPRSAKNGRTLKRPRGQIVGLWLRLVCYVGEWLRTPISCGGGPSNPTGQITRTKHQRIKMLRHFGPQSEVGTHTALLSYGDGRQSVFGPFPYMVSRLFLARGRLGSLRPAATSSSRTGVPLSICPRR